MKDTKLLIKESNRYRVKIGNIVNSRQYLSHKEQGRIEKRSRVMQLKKNSSLIHNR